ncbi:MAG: RNase P subunit p30 family protein [Candidatus Aenigmatarchaeota archaeon]
MKYEMHVQDENLYEAIELAKKLGWEGICITTKWKHDLTPPKIKKKGIDVAIGVEIEAKPHEIRKILPNIRKSFEIIMVRGGDLEVNREAVENPLVDVLLSPWGPRNSLRDDSGFNHIMAKLANKNNVAIEFNFSDLMYSYKKTRIRLLSHISKAAKLVNKYNAPFIISSGARDAWDLKSPSELISLGKTLGLTNNKIKKSISDKIVKENRKRLSGSWIMPGVELE